MLDRIRIEDDGPDGMSLIIEGEFDFGSVSASGKLVGQVSDDLLRELDEALRPWREHMAEGEAIRQEYETHRASGYCGNWVDGYGPCYLPTGHNEDCQASMLGRDDEAVL